MYIYIYIYGIYIYMAAYRLFLHPIPPIPGETHFHVRGHPGKLRPSSARAGIQIRRHKPE